MANSKKPAETGAVDIVERLLAEAVRRQASDVHFEPQDGVMLVRYRLDGVLHEVDRLPGAMAESVVARLKVLAGLLTYRMDVPQEGSFARPAGGAAAGRRGGGAIDDSDDDGRNDHGQQDEGAIDVRVATFPTVRGERAVVRLLYSHGQVKTLGGLGLRPEMIAALRGAAERPHGLLLVTGPAGSGKSTTVYALARHILSVTPGRSVVSLEDPVEQRVAGMAQIQVAPHGELNYIRAMRSLLRQDVQVLIVGEIRDAETAHVVVEASLTGHLIMSTMHSGDPAEALTRLCEMGIAPYQVVGAVSVVSSQRLLRTLCSACRAAGGAPATLVSYNKAPSAAAHACETCGGTRHKGRTACGQVAVMDERLREAVLRHAAASELRSLLAEAGPDLVGDARRLEREGATTREEILRVLGTCV